MHTSVIHTIVKGTLHETNYTDSRDERYQSVMV